MSADSASYGDDRALPGWLADIRDRWRAEGAGFTAADIARWGAGRIVAGLTTPVLLPEPITVKG